MHLRYFLVLHQKSIKDFCLPDKQGKTLSQVNDSNSIQIPNIIKIHLAEMFRYAYYAVHFLCYAV